MMLPLQPGPLVFVIGATNRPELIDPVSFSFYIYICYLPILYLLLSYFIFVIYRFYICFLSIFLIRYDECI